MESDILHKAEIMQTSIFSNSTFSEKDTESTLKTRFMPGLT